MVTFAGSGGGGALTVTTNEEVAVARPSLTLRVIVATPDWPLAAAKEMVRLAPEPPSTILVCGIKPRFELLAETVSKARVVSTSPTVKASGPTEVPVEIF